MEASKCPNAHAGLLCLLFAGRQVGSLSEYGMARIRSSMYRDWGKSPDTNDCLLTLYVYHRFLLGDSKVTPHSLGHKITWKNSERP
jgi:hypothetical protein